jgi:uncharacterized protein YndB with AHSA1/START domain
MSNTFKAERVIRTATLTLHATPERVFPLFGPVREAEWADGWQPNMIYAESELAEERGAVFTTTHPGEADTIWMITFYDRDRFMIEYVRATPESRIAVVTIQCEAEPNGTTASHVTYQFTALSEAGNRSIEQFSEAHYAHMMSDWESAISHTLATDGRKAHHA